MCDAAPRDREGETVVLHSLQIVFFVTLLIFDVKTNIVTTSDKRTLKKTKKTGHTRGAMKKNNRDWKQRCRYELRSLSSSQLRLSPALI